LTFQKSSAIETEKKEVMPHLGYYPGHAVGSD